MHRRPANTSVTTPNQKIFVGQEKVLVTYCRKGTVFLPYISPVAYQEFLKGGHTTQPNVVSGEIYSSGTKKRFSL